MSVYDLEDGPSAKSADLDEIEELEMLVGKQQEREQQDEKQSEPGVAMIDPAALKISILAQIKGVHHADSRRRQR